MTFTDLLMSFIPPVVHSLFPVPILLCIPHVLHPSCCAYLMPCSYPVVHSSCPAPLLSCIPHVLHPSCRKFLMHCPYHVTHHVLYPSCLTFLMTCILPVVHFSCLLYCNSPCPVFLLSCIPLPCFHMVLYLFCPTFLGKICKNL